MFRAVSVLLYISTLAADLPPQVIHARRLVENIDPANNSYRHKHPEVQWQNPDGTGSYICHADCSGFMDALLMYSYNLTRPQFIEVVKRKWPHPHEYYTAITEGNGFTQIPTIKAAVVGDIITVKFPPGLKNTGHVMMIDGVPTIHESSRPLIDNTIQWAVPIIDCTSDGHGHSDSRYVGNDVYNHGVGRGIIRLYTDQEGNVVGYTWAIGPHSEFKSCSDHPIAIGRFGGV